jgi:hypothetical protein
MLFISNTSALTNLTTSFGKLIVAHFLKKLHRLVDETMIWKDQIPFVIYMYVM